MAVDTLGYLAKEYPILADFLTEHKKQEAWAARAKGNIGEALAGKQACGPCVDLDLALAENYIERGMAQEAYDCLRRFLGPGLPARNPSQINVGNATDIVLPIMAQAAVMAGSSVLAEFGALSGPAFSAGIAGAQGLLGAAEALRRNGAAEEAINLSVKVMEKPSVRGETLAALRIALSACLDADKIDAAREIVKSSPLKNAPEIDPSGFLSSATESDDISFTLRLSYILGRREEAAAGLSEHVSLSAAGLVEELACLASELGDREMADWCVNLVLSNGIPSRNPELLCRIAERLVQAGDIAQAVETYGLVIETGQCVGEAKAGLAEAERLIRHAESLESGACPEPPRRLFSARRHMNRGERALAREQYLLFLELDADAAPQWRGEAERCLAECLGDEESSRNAAEANATVLIASPVRQKPAILREFLKGLACLEFAGDEAEVSPDFLFVDDNTDSESSELLYRFRPPAGKVFIAPYSAGNTVSSTYVCDSVTHRWSNDLMNKVGDLKDFIIEFALMSGYDYVFFIDSDIVLHPKTLIHLVWTDRDIVSEVFWTKWQPDAPELPQVWLTNQYSLYELAPGETLSKQELNRRANRFMQTLRNPGIYRVGGLGACTLVKRRCFEEGARFSRIDNISLQGEDRFFCLRARAVGLGLWADTMYPPLHIYRDSDLARVSQPLTESRPARACGSGSLRSREPRLTLSMLVRNESGRYLREVLGNAAKYVDEAVILDDASDDNTADVCREVMAEAGVPLTLVSNKTPGFGNEVALRKQLWDLALALGAEWVLCLDADEMLEEAAGPRLRRLIEQTHSDVIGLRLYDMWDPRHYRDDPYWSAHWRYFRFLVRYRPMFEYIWRETPVHCGRFPANLDLLPNYCGDLRIKHLGWMDPSDREKKYRRYLASDPKGKYGSMEQYKSIMDPNPNLVRWQE